MKKNISILVFALAIVNMAMFLVPNVSASEIDNYVLENQGTEKDIMENQKDLDYAKKAIEKLIEEDSQIATYAGMTRDGLSEYPIFKQEKNYYCGPASIKEAIHHINGSSASQDTYASSMGTASSGGTYVYKMRDELNKRQSKIKFVYEQQNSNNNSTRVTNMFNVIRLNASINSPVILHAKTGSIYMYNGRNVGHYITAIAVSSYNGTPKKVEYVDSFYNDYGRGSVYGFHEDTIENMANAVAGRYLIYGNGALA